MDDELFEAVYHAVFTLSPRRGKRVQFGDAMIVVVYLWSVIRNKPMMWACKACNSPAALRDVRLPSCSTLSRRMDSESVQQLIQALEESLKQTTQTALVGCWMIDAKPLVVSPYSKDKQAKRGWAYDGIARGYKLFAMCDLDKRFMNWQVHPMNVAEPTVAVELLAAADRPGYVLGDSIYDSTPLHAAAAERHLQLIAPRKVPGGPIGPRARHPHRLHAIEMLETPVNTFGRAIYRLRSGIERNFSRLASGNIGLDHLPGWVRTHDRVRRWVQGKLILYALQN